MLLWKFKTYVSSSGRNDIQAAIDRYDDYALEAFSRAVRHLAVATKDKWDEPHAKKLKGKALLFEVRFKANRCQTRALGYFGPGAEDFTITMLCTHKQNIYAPPDAIETAARRAEQVRQQAATAVALTIDGEDISEDDESSERPLRIR